MKRKTGKQRVMAYGEGGLFGDPSNPGTGVYKTQAEIDAANAQAKRLVARNANSLISPEETYVARKVGDPKVGFFNPDGTVYKGTPRVDTRIKKLPLGVTVDQVQSQDGLYWYENNDGNMVEVDPVAINGMAKVKKPAFAEGGEKQTDWKGVAGLANTGMGLADAIMGLLEGNQAYSKEPIVNASTVRNMVSPYAEGGEVGGGMMDNLQAMADQYGVSVEELVQMLQEQQAGGGGDGEGEEEDYQEEDAGEGEEEDYQSARFAMGGKKRAKKFMYAFGGVSPIEVEGEEVIQTPNGRVKEVKGAKHENGGVDVNVPDGTRIYSDRIKIDDKTMADRKKSRERAMKRLNKLAEKSPGDTILANTLKRTASNHAQEEEEDMAVMETLRTINNKKFAGGGVKNGIPVQDWQFGLPADEVETLSSRSNAITNRGVVDNGGANVPNLPAPDVPGNPWLKDPGLSLGDYTGLAGNLFNAVAPIINTNRNRRATQPNINRFLGFGHDAIVANDKAQDLAAETATNKLIDVNTAANTAKLRNRNSASSVNTVRALDIATDMGVDKATANAYDTRNNALMNLFGQRGQIEMQNDRMEMQGDTNRDIADKQDTDNYYTNLAQNLTNFGTNIQGVGKNLNTAKSNRIDTELISQLSKYGLSFDENGKLISK